MSRNAHRALRALIVLALAGGGTGCVSNARFDAMQAERDTYRHQVEELTRSDEVAAGRQDRIAELERARVALEKKLESEIAAGRVRVAEVRDGLAVELAQEILFESGSAKLDANGERVLRQVAVELERSGYPISVMGHTDDAPIGPGLRSRYASNWELGAARASSVTRLMIEAGIAPERLAAVSYGEFRPAVPNSDEAGRAHNRRIEIRLQPLGVGKGSS